MVANGPPTKACWKSSTPCWSYSDKERTPDGLHKLKLREGLDGKAKITVKSRRRGR